MKSQAKPVDWKNYCAACYARMDVPQPFFICRVCFDSLSPVLRHRIVSSEDRDEQRAARREAMLLLSQSEEVLARRRVNGHKDIPDANDIRMPPLPRKPREGCSHDDKWLRGQPNMITGQTDKVCIKCGKVRYAQTQKPREVIA